MSQFVGKRSKVLYCPYHFEAQKAEKNVNAYTYCMKDRNYFEEGEDHDRAIVLISNI